MKELSLSIEELIYSFYSEGHFEQGNALKQVYFPDLTDDKMDLLLQATCRSLLAKDLLHYHQHKFSLKEKLAAIISLLNYSEHSLKASRHSNGREESFSIHMNGDKMVQHSLHYDEQVHSFKSINNEEAIKLLAEFFQTGISDGTDRDKMMMTREAFEGLLNLVDQKIYHSPNLSDMENTLLKAIGEGEGLLNTILFFEFNEKREAEAKEVVLFTNRDKNNWMIEQKDDEFYVGPGTESAIGSFMNRHKMPSVNPARGK